LAKEPDIARLLLEKPKPEDGDAIAIGSDTEDERRADPAAKYATQIIVVSH
jgi:hypothetical protein